MITTREIKNTYTPDLTLDQQIKMGICDWELQTDDGRVFFGHTEQEAINNMSH